MRREHSSFSDFLDFAAREPLVSEHGCSSSRNYGSEARRWTGCSNFDEAMKLARFGWAEGLELINKQRAQFESIIGDRIKRPKLIHDLHGFMPDVGAYCEGEPENMFSRESVEVNAPGRIIHVVANGSISGAYGADKIMMKGALICALIDALENAGYSCQLTACFMGREPRVSAVDFIPVKGAGEPLELDRVAFAFAHPSMLRRIIFSAWEQDVPFMKETGNMYGAPADVPEADRGDLYFPSAYLPTAGRDVIHWFKAQLAPLGITFDE